MYDVGAVARLIVDLGDYVWHASVRNLHKSNHSRNQMKFSGLNAPHAVIFSRTSFWQSAGVFPVKVMTGLQYSMQRAKSLSWYLQSGHQMQVRRSSNEKTWRRWYFRATHSSPLRRDRITASIRSCTASLCS